MTIGSQDLAGALGWIAVYLGVLALVAGLAVWLARRRGSTTIAVDAARAVAQVWLVLSGLGVVLIAWRAIAGGESTLTDLPVTMDWPGALPAARTGSDAVLVWATANTASVTVEGLSLGTRLLIGLAELLALVLAATPAVVIWVITRQAVRGAPFTGTVSRWLLIAAAAVLVVGLATDVVSAIGRTLAAMEVLPGPGSGAPVTTTGLFNLSVPLWPIGAALALAALAAVFRYGTVLQRETEGLV